MNARILVGIMTLIAFIGVLLSLFTEFIQGVEPCLSCYILRYSYLSILLLSPFSLRYKAVSRFLIALSIFIVVISGWGLMGSLGYLNSPCIDACSLQATSDLELRLFSLAMIGGLMELILSLAQARSEKS